MNITISTPYPVDSLHGNTISAKRIEGILAGSNVEVELVQSSETIPSNTDALIALHARKSHASIIGARKLNSEAKIIVYLTGTDLYGDIPNGCQLCTESLEIADAIVVSQEASFNSVPRKYRSKTHVVYNSIQLPKLSEVEQEEGLFTIASHLREVKQPFLAAEALTLVHEPVCVKLLGAEIDKGSVETANLWMGKEPRFEWLGQQSYEQTLTLMKRSVATINTSLSEGGANAVGESIVLGVPVLASKIEGNIGMLGNDYQGYFRSGSASELAGLIHKFMTDPSFRNLLQNQVDERSKKYSRENEREGWLALLKI